MTAEQNYRLLCEIEANRNFLLMAHRQNPALLARAEPRIRQLLNFPEAPPAALETTTARDCSRAAVLSAPTIG